MKPTILYSGSSKFVDSKLYENGMDRKCADLVDADT